MIYCSSLASFNGKSLGVCFGQIVFKFYKMFVKTLTALIQILRGSFNKIINCELPCRNFYTFKLLARYRSEGVFPGLCVD